MDNAKNTGAGSTGTTEEELFESVVAVSSFFHVCSSYKNSNGKCRDEGDQKQCNKEESDHWHGFFGDAHNRNIRQRTCNKQVDTDRRCNKSDCKIDNHDNTKLNRIHSDGFYDRKQDRCEDQDGRCGIHDHADDQKE